MSIRLRLAPRVGAFDAPDAMARAIERTRVVVECDRCSKVIPDGFGTVVWSASEAWEGTAFDVVHAACLDDHLRETFTYEQRVDIRTMPLADLLSGLAAALGRAVDPGKTGRRRDTRPRPS
ncbi:MAG: hypothetical protein ACREMM_08745 [Gemmatimonadales bacterium]